jgi:hypothetical protein
MGGTGKHSETVGTSVKAALAVAVAIILATATAVIIRFSGSSNPQSLVPLPPPGSATPRPAAPISGSRADAPSHRIVVQRRVTELSHQLTTHDLTQRAAALAELRQIAQSDPTPLADRGADWIGPLVEAKQTDALLELTEIAIAAQAFDSGLVEQAQRARIVALLDASRTDEAVSEAKAYYNVAALQETSDAVELVVRALNSAGKLELAGRFRDAQFTGSENASPTGAFSALAEVSVDGQRYQSSVMGLESRRGRDGSYSTGNLMARGNLYLLQDRTADALHCFEDLCRAAPANDIRLIREAIGGMSRAVRAQDGRVDRARAFLLSAQATPQDVIASLQSPADVAVFRTAASQINVDDLRSSTPPALEVRREQQEAGLAKHAAVAANAGRSVKIISGFSCSAPLSVEQISDSHFKIAFEGKRGSMDNYFLFRLEGVAGKTIRIDFEHAPLNKWWSLNPVYSYAADLDDPSSFRSAVVGDPAKTVPAHNGPLIPDTSGEQWHFMPNVWCGNREVDRKNGTLCMVQTFDQNVVYVGLKIPYTPGYNQRLMTEVSASSLAQVFEIGRSPQGRPLQLVKVGGTDADDRSRPCVLLYGREHGTEQDSSWAVEGALRFLISDDPEAAALRDRLTFLLLPICDPDAADESYYDRTTYSFTVDRPSSEAIIYANWFEAWVDAGKRLDVVLDLHNIESAEGEHLSYMYPDPHRISSCRILNNAITDRMQDGTDLHIRPGSVDQGFITNRLAGWLGYCFGPLHGLYELNSQEKWRHLTLDEVRDMGRRLILATSDYLHSDDGKAMMAFVDRVRAERVQRLATIGRGRNAVETKMRGGFAMWELIQREKGLPQTGQ